MEAIWFEGLSRRQLAERLPWGKSQIDRIERAARAKLGADPKLRELFESMSHRLRTAPEGGA
jgi:ribosome-binding protein aMBF1 (putative translation factor)